MTNRPDIAQPTSVNTSLLVWQALLAVGCLYLDVPIRHAIPIATVLTTQMAIGFLLIATVLPSLSSTPWILAGPGLVVGGATSFFIFQLCGRGPTGAILTVLIGLVALGLIVSRERSNLMTSIPWWTFGQVIGITALALSSEFQELFPITLTALLWSLLTVRKRPTTLFLRSIFLLVPMVLPIIALFRRNDYWWIVTDDYQMFEVLGRHITRNGIFESLGAAEIWKYHWLSYGWSGLLSYVGGSPEPYITLSKVMPMVYSLIFGSSLILVAENALGRRLHMLSDVLPIWTVSALTTLEWTGTSTAGGISTVAALFSVLSLTWTTRVTRLQRMMIYLVFVPIIALTKLPSIFAALLIILLTEVYAKRTVRSHANLIQILIASTLVCGTIFLALLLGRFAGWEVTGNPVYIDRDAVNRVTAVFVGARRYLATDLPQLAGTVLVAAFALVAAGQLEGQNARKLRLAVISVIPVLALIPAIELIIWANGTDYLYFSRPILLVFNLYLLHIILHRMSESASRFIVSSRSSLLGLTIVTAIVAAVLLWNRNFFAASLISLVLVISSALFPQTRQNKIGVRALGGVCLAIVIVTCLNISRSAIVSLSSDASFDNAVSLLGPTESVVVGDWLRRNTDNTDLVATNYIIDKEGKPIEDYSLGVWSQRSFLVLGPEMFKVSFYFGEGSTKANEVLSFSNTADSLSAKQLLRYGVKWFIVDTTLTERRNWAPYAERVFGSGRFIVLRLRDDKM